MKTKVLVIEDQSEIRMDIAEALEFDGMDVAVADNGNIGIQKAQELLPDLIICDINMPEKDGYSVLEELQSESTTANIPFIFLTAIADRSAQRRGMSLGADDYITKPFTTAELLSAVKTRLARIANITSEYQNQTNQLRETLIKSIPHELRTPLVGIINGAEILVNNRHGLEDEQLAELSDIILRSGKRLHQLIEHYLLFAQLEIIKHDQTRIQELRRENFDYPNLIIQQAASQKAIDKDRKEDLEIYPGENYLLHISVSNLTKIIEELVDNALKFSDRGTSVKVATYIKDNQYVIEITDQGRGMSPEQIKKIGAFMQFNRELYEQQGAGFGLIIAKRMIELHGGQMLIESKLDTGTRIRIKLPIT